MTLASLRFRRGLAADWTAANPILSLGEPGWETDTTKGKVGDGSTVWNALPYTLGYSGFTAVAAGVGIDATGVTDSTTALQSLITGMPSTGGVLFLPPGTYKIGTLNFTKPITILGSGGSLLGDGALSPIRAITTLVTTSSTADALVFTSPGITLRDFALVNDAGSTPSAGIGIKALIPNASQMTMNGVTVVGFFDNVQANGVYWTVTGCHNYDPVRYGWYMPKGDTNYNDHGDMGITNSVFSGMFKSWNPTAFIRWESGGGLRLTGSKLNGGQQPYSPGGVAGKPAVCLDIAVADGVQTGSFTISGNSISGGTTAQVRLGQTGSTLDGIISKISIVGNDIGVGYGTGDGIIAGSDNAHSSAIRDVVISGNNFAGVVNSISGGSCASLIIGKNAHNTVTRCILLNQYNGSFRQIAPQDVPNYTTQVLYQVSRDLDQANLQADVVEHEYGYAFALSSGLTAKNMMAVKAAQGSTRGGSFLLDVTVTGYYDGTGPFYLKQRRVGTWTNSGSVTVTTAGTDESTGAGAASVSLTYTVSTTTVTIAVVGPGGAAVLNGRAHIRAYGQIAQFSRS